MVCIERLYRECTCTRSNHTPCYLQRSQHNSHVHRFVIDGVVKFVGGFASKGGKAIKNTVSESSPFKALRNILIFALLRSLTVIALNPHGAVEAQLKDGTVLTLPKNAPASNVPEVGNLAFSDSLKTPILMVAGSLPMPGISLWTATGYHTSTCAERT